MLFKQKQSLYFDFYREIFEQKLSSKKWGYIRLVKKASKDVF